MEIKYFSPTELKDYENNAKLHPDSQIRLIIRNIEQAGFYNPILISPDKTIIAGHGRRKAAIQAGLKEVPCIVLDVDTTTANKLRLMDNKSAESGYDLEKLVEELQTFSKAEIDDTGYSLSDLDRMLDDLGKISVIPSNGAGPGYFDDEPDEAESDGDSKEYQGSVNEDFDSEHEDDVPEETEVETRVKEGDIWQLGNHFILCGDCTVERNVRELLGSVKVDMVFTDPPYGMRLDCDFSKMGEAIPEKGVKKSKGYENIIGDNEDYDPSLLMNMFEYVKEQFWFGADYYSERLPSKNDGSWIVWDKRVLDSLDNRMGSSFELCWSKTKHRRVIARVKWTGFFGTETQDTRKRIHPTQKPIELPLFFFEHWGKESKVIIDFYLGSGTTLIACEKTNRVCFGSELSEKYCDVIVTRWEKLTGKTAKLLRNINS